MTVAIYGSTANIEFIEWEKLRKKNIRYIGTDFELSGCDIYEIVENGHLVATKIK